MREQSMKSTYSTTDDALYITLAKPRGRIVTREASPGVYLDFDQRRALVGIEVLDASAHYSKAALHQIEAPIEWITLAEAARESADDGKAIEAVTLRALVASGELQGRKIGKTWQVAAHSLWNYLENRPKRGPKAKSRRTTAA
jgi:uncharacterized protein YuzE